MATRASGFPWKLSEIVTLVVLAVALGVLWWGWTLLYALATPLHAVGADYLFVGVWMTGGTLIPFLIRRPGAAFFGELLAAIVEGFITQWGVTAILWGAVQGVAAEAVFFAVRYRRWDLPILMIAGAFSGLLSWGLDFLWYNYSQLVSWVWIVQAGSTLVGGAVWAGVVAWLIGRGVIRTGVLQNLLHEQYQGGDR